MGNKKPLNELRSRILAEMRNGPNITTAQLRITLNCAETLVENNIAYLRKNGYIERVGSRKNGYFRFVYLHRARMFLSKRRLVS